jgi:hypothetical protein
MKHENTEKFLKDIRTLICDKFNFSFEVITHITKNGSTDFVMQIFYNNGAGRCKAILDQSIVGAHTFVSQLINHKNCTSNIVHKNFWQVCKPVETTATAKDYKKTKEVIYFDGLTSRVMTETIDFDHEYFRKADVYISDRLPGMKILKGKNVEVSVMVDGFVFGIERTDYENKDKIQTSIDYLFARVTPDELEEHLRLRLISKTIEKWQELEAKPAPQPQNQPIAQLTAETAKNEPYTLTDAFIYFDYTFQQKTIEDYKTNRKDHQRGRLVLVSKYPDVQIVKHSRFEGTTVSLLYAGNLLEFEDMIPGGDEITKAIELIDRKGIDVIMGMAKSGVNYA